MSLVAGLALLHQCNSSSLVGVKLGFEKARSSQLARQRERHKTCSRPSFEPHKGESEMALFNSEAERDVRPEMPMRAASVPASAPITDNTIAPPLATEARAYLDQGSKVSGKLTF